MFIPNDTELLTHKAGKWKFSAQCDQATVYPLLVRAETLYEAVRAIPILPEWQARLKTELIKRSIHGTAAIEGNPLTLEEVGAELQNPGTSGSAQAEIANLKTLYDFLKNKEQLQAPLSESLIKDFHAVLMKGLVVDGNPPGHYRTACVKVGDAAHGGVYTPPRILKDIADLMAAFMGWYDSNAMRQLNPLLQGACVHYYLARIHPFRDGNGRTARFAEAYVLAQNGLELIAPMLSNHYYLRQDDYFSVFSATAKTDMTPFFSFVLSGVYESLKTVQQEIIPLLEKFIMRDFITFLRRTKKINDRQRALLEMLLEHPRREITLDALFSDPLFRGYYVGKVSTMTARRDLHKLRTEELLIEGTAGLVLNWKYLSMR